MLQRVTLISMVLVAAACIVATSLAWWAVQQIGQSNQALLAKLESFQLPVVKEPAEEKLPLEWSELTVRLVKGKKGGEPGEGFTVNLLGNAIHPNKNLQLKEHANAEGIVHFGPIRPGSYNFWVNYQHANKYWQISNRHNQIVLFPGRKHNEEIICPPAAPEEAVISFSVDLPQDLKDKDLFVRCHFLPPDPVFESEGHQWNVVKYRRRELVLTASGQVVNNIQSEGYRDFVGGGGLFSSRKITVQLPSKHLSQDVRWPAWNYKLDHDWILLPGKKIMDGGGERFLLESISSHSYRPDPPVYEARADGVNQWKIEIPDVVVEKVRRHLEQSEKAAEKSAEAAAEQAK